MNPYGYNPAEHGFPAKVWECMRRNAKFRKAIQKAHDAIYNQGPINYSYSPEGHPIAGRLGEVLARGFYYDRRDYPCGLKFVVGKRLPPRCPAVCLEMTWPQLPQPVREMIEDSLSVHLPVEYDIIPRELLSDSKKRGTIADAIGQLLVDQVSLGWKIFLVPEIIRDKGHRKAILAEIDRLIPEAPVDLRKFEPTGSVLGAGRDWDAYLVYTHYEAAGLPLSAAKALANWYCCDPDDFNDFAEEDRRSKWGLAQARSHGKQKNNTEVGIRKILKAIESVFPCFGPHQGEPGQPVHDA